MRACGSLCVNLWERRAAGRTADQGLACGMQASGGMTVGTIGGRLAWHSGYVVGRRSNGRRRLAPTLSG